MASKLSNRHSVGIHLKDIRFYSMHSLVETFSPSCTVTPQSGQEIFA
jgi:hypothetical protein